MKRLLALIAFAVGMALPLCAHAAFCTNVAVSSTNTSTQILAASTSSSAPPRVLTVQAGGACPVWVNIGAAAAVGTGYFVAPGDSPTVIPAAQYPPNSFPQTQSGAVNAFLPAAEGCSATSVTACRQ